MLPLAGKGELLELEKGEAARLGVDPDPGEVVEPRHGQGRLTKAVFHLRQDEIGRLIGRGLSETVIELHSERWLADVVLGKARIKEEFHLGLDEGGGGFSLHRIDRLLEEFAVEVEAN